MKKIIFIFLCLVLFIGCSKDDTEIGNELSIINNALAAISVNFRGNTYRLSVGETTTIRNIPNGSYTYETAATLPAGATSVSEGAHLAETLIFTGKTKYNLFYTGSLDATGVVYTVSATLSSSDPEKTASRLLNPF